VNWLFQVSVCGLQVEGFSKPNLHFINNIESVISSINNVMGMCKSLVVKATPQNAQRVM